MGPIVVASHEIIKHSGGFLLLNFDERLNIVDQHGSKIPVKKKNYKYPLKRDRLLAG